MPSQKNQDLLKSIKDQLKTSKSVVIADYSGLDVKAQNQLRAKIVEAGGRLLIAKNRIFKLAAKDHVKQGQEELEPTLKGQNAFLFSIEDAVSPLKALFDFAEDNESLEIKLGILGDRVLSFEETENLSKLPSKKELIRQLISRINGPAYGLVNVLGGPTRSLVYALKAIQEKKGSEAN